MIQGTNICVDKLTLNIPKGNYFLTHFHGDHYGGIRKSWRKGTLYCTSTTANLIRHKFKVSKKYIKAVEFNKTIDVEGHKVTFLIANHCPGACIILFELKDGRNILHTGDFRFRSDLFTSIPHLQPYLVGGQKTLDSVYLDTTYCNPEYNFPNQEEVFDFVWSIVRKFEKRSKGKFLYVFATYTIGKEKLLLDLARRMNKRIFVTTKKKFDILNCIEDDDLDLEENQTKSDVFTRNHDETCIQMGGFKTIFWKNFLQLTKGYQNSKYEGIIAFKPTCFPYPFPLRASKVNGNNFIINIPYSEHTPFGQLKKFVSTFQIKEIIPTVFSSRKPEQKEAEKENMIRLLREKPKKRRQSFFVSWKKNKKGQDDIMEDEEEEEEEEEEEDEDEDDDEEDEYWNERIKREKLVIPKNILQFTSSKRTSTSKSIASYFSTPGGGGSSKDNMTPLKSPHPSSFFNFEKGKKTAKPKKSKPRTSNSNVPPPPPRMVGKNFNLGKVVKKKETRNNNVTRNKKSKATPRTRRRRRKGKRNSSNGRRRKKKEKIDPNQKQISQFFGLRKKNGGREERVTGKKRKREVIVIDDTDDDDFQKPKKKKKKVT